MKSERIKESKKAIVCPYCKGVKREGAGSREHCGWCSGTGKVSQLRESGGNKVNLPNRLTD